MWNNLGSTKVSEHHDMIKKMPFHLTMHIVIMINLNHDRLNVGLHEQTKFQFRRRKKCLKYCQNFGKRLDICKA